MSKEMEAVPAKGRTRIIAQGNGGRLSKERREIKAKKRLSTLAPKLRRTRVAAAMRRDGVSPERVARR